MKIDIKMAVIKARVVLIVGEYEDIKKEIPFGLDCFGDHGYMARCVYRRREDKLPFTVVIHSRTAAISVIAHEAAHASSYILDGMGMLPDFANDELQAYLIQHICEVAESRMGTYDYDED